MIKLPKISFVTSTNELTGSTRMRVYCVSRYLNELGYKVSINNDLFSSDILIFQKSDYTFLSKKFLPYICSSKLLIFDIDDLYLGDYLHLVSGADFVIASTPYLANYYKQYNANISVWDGPLDVDDIRTNIKKSINYSRPKIGWFGTMLNLPILKELNIKKDITTITTGGDIEWRKETIDKEIQKFDLVCLPQRHNPQGFSKTNCRMLKSLYLGVPVLASSIPSYIELANFLDYPSELILGENDDWNERIEKIIIGEIKINLDFSKIRKLILSRYSIQNSVEKWLQLINSFHKEPRTSFFGKLKQRKDLIKDGINQCYINLTRNLIFKK